jgi:hypothetical protein
MKDCTVRCCFFGAGMVSGVGIAFAVFAWWTLPFAFRTSLPTKGSIPFALCDDPGEVNTYSCTLLGAFPPSASPSLVAFKAPTASTGPTTLRLNQASAKPLKKMLPPAGLQPLALNDIRAGQIVEVLDKRSFYLLCPLRIEPLPQGYEDCL